LLFRAIPSTHTRLTTTVRGGAKHGFCRRICGGHVIVGCVDRRRIGAAPGTLESGVNSALDWYNALDPTTKSAIDAATNDPGQSAVARSQAGVASGIDQLLNAFDQVQGTIGDLLQKAAHALEAAKQAEQV